MLCEYGCGREGKFYFPTVDKWCCSKNHKKCPGIKHAKTIILKKTICPLCKKSISVNRFKQHYDSCIKYNNCLNCGKKTKNPKFCSNRCSAIYNNKYSKKLKKFREIQKEKGKQYIKYEKQQSLINKEINIRRKQSKKRLCLYCGKEINSFKFCNNTCKTNYIRDVKIQKWLNGELSGTKKSGHKQFVKDYLIKKYNNKCSKCGWGEMNPYTKTIPVEIEHLDGNAYNNFPENVTLLCPNCHSLTKTYRGANKGNGRRSYLKKYYLKDNNGKIISG